MKTNDKKQLHDKSVPELTAMVTDLRAALSTLHLERAQRMLKNSRSIFEKRKDIAVISTILREKELKNENV